MRKINLLAKLAIAIVILLRMTSVGLSQSAAINEGELVYVRDTGALSEYVIMSNAARQVYDLPTNKCTSISTKGTYISQSSESQENLVIYRLSTLEQVAEAPWNVEWQPCAMLWATDNILRIRKEGDLSARFYFDITTGSLVPTSQPDTSPLSIPTLPDYYPSTSTDFILPSPEQDIYLYERCAGGEIAASGDVCLMGNDVFVIYDAASATDIHILQNPDDTRLRGYNAYTINVSQNAYPAIAWSRTGRYLAFLSLAEHGFDLFNLEIYDRQLDTYLDTDWVNAEVDNYKAMQWSPEADKLIF